MTVFILSFRDGIFAKDGRGWYTSASGRAHGLAWPFPSTVLGALRTAWGRREEETRKRAFARPDWTGALAIKLGKTVALRAPLFDSDQGTVCNRAWPVPLDALFMPEDKDKSTPAEIIRLDPVPPALQTLGRDNVPAREALWVPCLMDPRKPDSRPTWWPDSTFVAWLTKPVEKQDPQIDHAGFSPVVRFQAHVGIDFKTKTAMDGILYSHDVLETLDDQRHEWLLACEVEGWHKPPMMQIATLGGDRRPARMRVADASLFACPDTLRQAFDQERPPGMRLVVVTPMASDNGWLPEELAEHEGVYGGHLPGIDDRIELRAAFVGRPQHVSGWDMAKGAHGEAKRTTRLVPPGTVYYITKTNGAHFTGEDARALWLAALGTKTEEGFGQVVPGLWHPKEKST